LASLPLRTDNPAAGASVVRFRRSRFGVGKTTTVFEAVGFQQGSQKSCACANDQSTGVL
jgi:hypothetical protein